ncbi:MAG: hypothetical protein R3F49_03920 [Planctomycetota bacterium]
MDFLLECIGFPPGTDDQALVARIRAEGEGAPWRGDSAHHLRSTLGDGLELRADQEPGQSFWTVLPHYRAQHRLRVAVERVLRPAESPFDALLHGWACPAFGGGAPFSARPGARDHESFDDLERGGAPGLYRIATWITDARRLGQEPYPGHVLAISIAGFGVNVDAVIPNREVSDPSILERPSGAWIAPLGGPDDPGGCCDVSLRVRSLRRSQNAWTKEPVTILECDAPERPILLFVSPWQLARDGLALPRPGWRVEGTFLFSGRLEGGIPRPGRVAGRHFG